ncbi:MAG TPA: CHAP domain-containing protein [Solirubrobacteraceae bacterium]|jgi:hypothetical protein
MSIQSTVDRIDAIRQALANPATMIAARNPLTGGAEAPAEATTAASTSTSADASSPFASALTAASASYEPAQGVAGLTSSFAPSSGGTGSRIVAAAESQLGQSEMPPGSNESPAIAMYREATAGAAPGEPWCAYFASWASRQAGEPIGAAGEGLGSVGAIWSWAQSSGRAIANGPGVVPQPGDLIVFGDEHVGIVRGVLPDGRIETIEGNFENKVAANVRSASEATGYVSMT